MDGDYGRTQMVESTKIEARADEASEAKFFLKEDLPPLEEIAWPSAAYGLDAWRAFEPPRP